MANIHCAAQPPDSVGQTLYKRLNMTRLWGWFRKDDQNTHYSSDHNDENHEQPKWAANPKQKLPPLTLIQNYNCWGEACVCSVMLLMICYIELHVSNVGGHDNNLSKAIVLGICHIWWRLLGFHPERLLRPASPYQDAKTHWQGKTDQGNHLKMMMMWVWSWATR